MDPTMNVAVVLLQQPDQERAKRLLRLGQTGRRPCPNSVTRWRQFLHEVRLSSLNEKNKPPDIIPVNPRREMCSGIMQNNRA
jgi:hypothetical protein